MFLAARSTFSPLFRGGIVGEDALGRRRDAVAGSTDSDWRALPPEGKV
jgi:hypothetical protein